MRILIITAIIALPLMALGQTAEPQQTQAQTKETETTAPAKEKKKSPEQAKPETGTEVRGKTNVEGRAQEKQGTETGARSSTSQTNVSSSRETKVNVQEFKSRHSEVFNLGRHPKSFFIQKFGVQHVRLIGNTYFVFVDNCWVAVDVEGFAFAERVICAGDPDFIALE